MKLEEVLQIIQKCDANAQASDIVYKNRPALVTAPKHSSRSVIGGRPILPKGYEWPTHGGRPMQFIAQIFTDEIPVDGISSGKNACIFNDYHSKHVVLLLLDNSDCTESQNPPLMQLFANEFHDKEKFKFGYPHVSTKIVNTVVLAPVQRSKINLDAHCAVNDLQNEINKKIIGPEDILLHNCIGHGLTVNGNDVFTDPRIFAYLNEIDKDDYIFTIKQDKDIDEEIKGVMANFDCDDECVKSRLTGLREQYGRYLWWTKEFEQNAILVNEWVPYFMIKSSLKTHMMFGDMDTLVVLGKFNKSDQSSLKTYGIVDRYIMGFCH